MHLEFEIFQTHVENFFLEFQIIFNPLLMHVGTRIYHEFVVLHINFEFPPPIWWKIKGKMREMSSK